MKEQQTEISGFFTIHLEKDEILFRADDQDTDLYIIHSGKLMVYVIKGTQVTPLAYLGPGEYIGELSFFDQNPRSANIIALEKSSLIKIPVSTLDKQFPKWLITMAQSITKKLRYTDEIIRQKGIRKKNVETIQALSIDEQRRIFQLTT